MNRDERKALIYGLAVVGGILAIVVLFFTTAVLLQ